MLLLPVYRHAVLRNKPSSKPVDQNSSHLLLNCVSQEAPSGLAWAGWGGANLGGAWTCSCCPGLDDSQSILSELVGGEITTLFTAVHLGSYHFIDMMVVWL